MCLSITDLQALKESLTILIRQTKEDLRSATKIELYTDSGLSFEIYIFRGCFFPEMHDRRERRLLRRELIAPDILESTSRNEARGDRSVFLRPLLVFISFLSVPLASSSQPRLLEGMYLRRTNTRKHPGNERSPRFVLSVSLSLSLRCYSCSATSSLWSFNVCPGAKVCDVSPHLSADSILQFPLTTREFC